MAKKQRQIDFSGPSIQDLGLVIDEMTNTKNAINGQFEKKTISSSKEKVITDIGNNIASNTTFSKTGDVKPGKRRTIHFRLIRDYLNAVLGDNERVEIKLSEMGEELGIPLNTLYRHLKTLRETEFYITRLQYGTEIRRR